MYRRDYSLIVLHNASKRPGGGATGPPQASDMINVHWSALGGVVCPNRDSGDLCVGSRVTPTVNDTSPGRDSGDPYVRSRVTLSHACKRRQSISPGISQQQRQEL